MKNKKKPILFKSLITLMSVAVLINPIGAKAQQMNESFTQVVTNDKLSKIVPSVVGTVLPKIHLNSNMEQGSTPVLYNTGDVEIIEANFPDTGFRNYLKQESYGMDGKITPVEIEDWKTINVSNKTEINSLQGIEIFTALETLKCINTGISSLDVSKDSKLKVLDCQDNPYLQTLNVNGATALETLHCWFTGISSLDVSKNPKLKVLECNNNTNLQTLHVNGATALETLKCINTGISSLDVSKNPKLKVLECQDNASLQTLNVNGATALETLNCINTGISSLDVSKNSKLKVLKCRDNASLQTLNVNGATALETLNCTNTGISSLDVSANTALKTLDCSNTNLSWLKIGNNSNLTSINYDNSTLAINVTGNSFKITDMFDQINPNNVTITSNGSMNPTTGVVSITNANQPIIYTYDCGTSANGKQTLQVTLNMTITKQNSSITIKDGLDMTYTGSPINNPSIEATGSKGVLSITYEILNNGIWKTFNGIPTNAGTYKIKVHLAGDDFFNEESFEKEFMIMQKSIEDNDQIEISKINNNRDFRNLVIKDNGKVLVEGIDYDVIQKENGNVITVIIKGKGNYTGTITNTYIDNKTAQTGDPTAVELWIILIIIATGIIILINKKYKNHLENE